MAGTPNRHGEHSCDIVRNFFFQISQRKPDLIIEPHDGASKSHMGPSFAHTSPAPLPTTSQDNYCCRTITALPTISFLKTPTFGICTHP